MYNITRTPVMLYFNSISSVTECRCSIVSTITDNWNAICAVRTKVSRDIAIRMYPM